MKPEQVLKEFRTFLVRCCVETEKRRKHFEHSSYGAQAFTQQKIAFESALRELDRLTEKKT